MGVSRDTTPTDELLRLPAGGSFIVSDEQGNELFRVTATGDAVVADGQRLPVLRTVTVDVTAAQIAEGATIEAIPALGAGKGPILVTADILLLPGSVPFGSAAPVGLEDSDSAIASTGESNMVPFEILVRALTRFEIDLSNDATYRTNEAINLVIPACGYRGAILTHEIGNAGSGYEVGDTITMETPAGTTAPVITVATVDGGGAVLTYTITEAGTASPVGSVGQESTSGIGVDFVLNVLTISEDSDGTGRLLVSYYVADLA